MREKQREGAEDGGFFAQVKNLALTEDFLSELARNIEILEKVHLFRES